MDETGADPFAHLQQWIEFRPSNTQLLFDCSFFQQNKDSSQFTT
jgi:hypothetical protein